MQNYTVDATGITRIESRNAATLGQERADDRPVIILQADDDVQFTYRVEGSTLIIEGSGGNISGGINLQVGSVSGNVSGVKGAIHVFKPRGARYSTHNIHN